MEETSESNYGFSMGTQFGFVYGQAFEYVYPTGTTGGELLSELIWDMKPVFYFGFLLDFGRVDIMSGPGFFASVSFKTGIPADSGLMEDRDWQSSGNSLTDFSRHTNKTRALHRLDIYIGASIPVKTFLYIKPFVTGSWMSFSFSGRDGERFQPSPGTFSGEVIRYTQDWLLFAPGLSVGTKILSPFSFDISFKISPLIYCEAKDEHFLTNTVYRDFAGFAGWGLYIEPGASVSFTVKRFDLSLEFAWRYIGKTSGGSYRNASGAGYYLDGTAGAGLSLMDTRLLFRLHI